MTKTNPTDDKMEDARKIVAGLIQGQDEDVKIALLMKLEKQAVERFIENMKTYMFDKGLPEYVRGHTKAYMERVYEKSYPSEE